MKVEQGDIGLLINTCTEIFLFNCCYLNYSSIFPQIICLFLLEVSMIYTIHSHVLFVIQAKPRWFSCTKFQSKHRLVGWLGGSMACESLSYLMLKSVFASFLIWLHTGNVKLSLYCHYSQVHWLWCYLLGSGLWVK